MNKRKFGRTNLHVSELCLNLPPISGASDEAAAFALLDTYQVAGGDFIRTPGSFRDGSSAELVGRWIETRGIPRDRLVLASGIDLARPPHGGSIAFVNSVREACERLLRTLRTKHVDLLICNWHDQLAPVDDLLEAMDMMIRAGYVRYAVAGGFPPWRVVDSIHRSGARNQARFEALEAEYSLVTRDRIEPEMLSMVSQHRLGFLAHSPLAGGILARRPVSLRELINLDRSWSAGSFGATAATPCSGCWRRSRTGDRRRPPKSPSPGCSKTRR